MKAGANIMMPVVVGEGRRLAVGTAVDYAHYTFQQVPTPTPPTPSSSTPPPPAVKSLNPTPGGLYTVQYSPCSTVIQINQNSEPVLALLRTGASPTLRTTP